MTVFWIDLHVADTYIDQCELPVELAFKGQGSAGGEGRAQHSTVARENIAKLERGGWPPLGSPGLVPSGYGGRSINTTFYGMYQRHMRI